MIHSFLFRGALRFGSRVTVVKFLKFDEASHGAKKHGIATHGYYNGQNVFNRINKRNVVHTKVILLYIIRFGFSLATGTNVLEYRRW